VKASEIPEEIAVDLAGLDIGAVVHVSSITLPAGATPTDRSDFTIATIAGRMAEAAEPEATAAPAEGAAAPAEGEKKEG
jgi:large subunit ribosomal protein L25